MKLTFKFVLVFTVLVIVPVSAISYFAIRQNEYYLRQLALEDLTVFAEQAEGHVFTFFEGQKKRTADWAMD